MWQLHRTFVDFSKRFAIVTGPGLKVGRMHLPLLWWHDSWQPKRNVKSWYWLIRICWNTFQTHKRFKRTLFIRTKKQSTIFQDNPLCQATKRHLNNSWTVKNDENFITYLFLVGLCCFPVQCLDFYDFFFLSFFYPWKATFNFSKQFAAVQISSRWYLCARKPRMRSIPSLRCFISSFLWNSSNVRLTDDGPLSSFQWSLSSTFSFHASLLQAIDGAMSLALCPQVVAQAPQLSRSSEKQTTCECCYGRQFIHSVVSLHSGVPRAMHPQEFSQVGVDHCHIPVWESDGGRESEKKHVRHILFYKIYKTLHGTKYHTQSQATFTFYLIKPY